MLTVTEIKEIMEEPDMPNEKAEQIRDACYELVQLARESLLKKHAQAKSNSNLCAH